jgi:hydroxymethylpyrimidine pyrophosphatase-like HAD family hydrolase
MEYLRAIHYFRVPENEQQGIKEKLHQPLADLVAELNAVAGGPPMEVVDFDSSFDIVPVGTGKGPAIDDILEYVQAGGARPVAPIYFGDNPGDIPAGQAVQARGGVFVSVGDDPDVIAAADFHLPDTASARAVYTKAAGMDRAPALLPPELRI